MCIHEVIEVHFATHSGALFHHLLRVQRRPPPLPPSEWLKCALETHQRLWLSLSLSLLTLGRSSRGFSTRCLSVSVYAIAFMMDIILSLLVAAAFLSFLADGEPHTHTRWTAPRPLLTVGRSRRPRSLLYSILTIARSPVYLIRILQPTRTLLFICLTWWVKRTASWWPDNRHHLEMAKGRMKPSTQKLARK